MKNRNRVRIAINAKRWPYIHKSLLTGGKGALASFLLETNTSGNIIASITKGYITRRFKSQPLIINEPGIFELSLDFTVNDLDIKIKANGSLLISDAESNSKPFIIKTDPYIPDEVTYPDLFEFKIADESEDFFLRTVNDLLKRFNSSDSYETLKSAGLLRLLLLDNPCLIDIINKKYKLKLEYKPNDLRLMPKGISGDEERLINSSSLYPTKARGKFAPPKVRNAFLKVPSASVGSQMITIEDIVLYCAHKAGGVHYDLSTPNKPGQSKVKELDSIIKTSDKPQYHERLHEITFLTLQGILPLVNAILESAKAEAQI